MEEWSTQALSCTQDDSGWSMLLPNLLNVHNDNPNTIELKTADYFEIKQASRLVELKENALRSFEWCKDLTSITISVLIKSKYALPVQ